MEKTQPNDLINPTWVDYGVDDRGYTHSGLTKREHFAAMVMQGILSSNPEYLHGNVARPVRVAVAAESVIYADALIEELNK